MSMCVVKPMKACLWSDAFFVWCSPRGLVKAPHDSGVDWKQFMMLLEEVLVCGGVAFHPPLRVPGRRKGFIRVTGQRSAGVASVLPYLLSC